MNRLESLSNCSCKSSFKNKPHLHQHISWYGQFWIWLHICVAKEHPQEIYSDCWHENLDCWILVWNQSKGQSKSQRNLSYCSHTSNWNSLDVSNSISDSRWWLFRRSWSLRNYSYSARWAGHSSSLWCLYAFKDDSK